MLVLEHASLRDRIEDVSLQLRPGEVLALIGPNGAGKSSLLSLLSGLTMPDRGQALLGDTPLRHLSAGHLARHRAVLEQRTEVATGFTVREVIAMGSYLHGHANTTALAVALARVEGLLERRLSTLSGGETQRVLLARALAQLLGSTESERYLLLDEPTAALDIGMADGLMLQIGRIAKQHRIGVLAVVHDLNLGLRHADRVALLDRGHLVACGPTAEVMQRSRLEEVYGVRLAELIHDEHEDLRAFVPLPPHES
ncbi:ATP-binding cassette domain-containing protein [Crenobacter sp. SG2303]|uniref:ATP-binding cassette domain-containing protein n=1 Tax=Crenobacter oryzisoli TaxID=3056844 RepID=A0ABT7XRD9_9NEIS|nr:ATP-binding cassette domain-containing protein [Crenobacter sp. SG2303]MDN0076351.1 ATP-binding cassette domain-containing protein [Crenobacter sp. SG2303]